MDPFPDPPSGRPSEPARHTSPGQPPQLSFGQVLAGRYRLLSALGRGGMGVVYAALDLQANRKVAVKVLLAAGNVPRERFAREGEITASLIHPGILRVHSYGVDRESPYLVYELVHEARTLDQVLPELPIRGRVALIRDAARALAYAHERGVVHRDVKPGNVLVDTNERVRVADFGLATAVGLERLTLSGGIVGTPLYMAPEQVREGAIAPSCDVWALGVLLYEALCGDVPCQADSMAELVTRLLSLQRAPSPRQVDRTVPLPLDAVCRKALAPVPEDRYPHAGSLADDLQAWLDGDRVSASGSSGASLPAARTLVLCALPALALLLLLFAAFSGAPVPPPPSSPDAEVAERSPPSDPAEGAEQWKAIRRLADESDRLRAAEGWLSSYPEHPLRSTAEATLDDLARRVPRYRLAHAGLQSASYLRDGRVLYWGNGGLFSWSPATGDVTSWWADSVWIAGSRGELVAACSRSELRVLGLDRSLTFKRRYPRPPEQEGGAPPSISALAFAPNGSLLAAAGHLRRIEILALPSGEPVLQVDRGAPVSALVFTPDSQRLIVAEAPSNDADMSALLRVVDVHAGSRFTLTLPFRPMELAVSADGRYLMVGDTGGGITRVEIDGDRLHHPNELRGVGARPRTPLAEVRAHDARIGGLALRGSLLVSASGSPRQRGQGPDNDVAVWDSRSGALLGRGLSGQSMYTSLDLAPPGLLISVYAKEIQIWSPRVLPSLANLEQRLDPAARWSAVESAAAPEAKLREALLFRHDFPASPVQARATEVIDALSPKVPVRRLEHPGLSGACFLDDLGQRVLTWSDLAEGQRLIWSAVSSEPQPLSIPGALTCVARSASGRSVAACGPNGKLWVLDPSGSVRSERALCGPDEPRETGRPLLRALAFSQDGRHVALGGWANSVYVVDLYGEASSRWPRPSRAPVSALAFSEGDSVLLVASGDHSQKSEDYELRAVDPRSGRARSTAHSLPDQPTQVLATAAYVLVGGGSGSVLRLDPTLQDALLLRGVKSEDAGIVPFAHRSGVRGLCAARGKLLSLSGSPYDFGDLATWDLASGLLLGRALKTPVARGLALDVCLSAVLVARPGHAELWALEGIPGLED